MYRLLWRHGREAGDLWDRRLDPDVLALEAMARQVRRDVHRCHAFLRFRRAEDALGEIWLAHHDPDHDVLPLALPFFVDRLGESRWWVTSRRRTAYFDGQKMAWFPGRPPPPPAKAEGENDDGVATSLWRTYFSATFNPARVNPRLLRQQMPRRFWRQLPEAAGVPALVRGALAQGASTMQSPPTPRPAAQLSLLGDGADPPRPAASPRGAEEAPSPAPAHSLADLRAQAMACRVCPWSCDATQTVFGQGPEKAAIMLVGEQPGDQEDLAGAPFVGPAGRLLREILAEVPLDPAACYLTNAVKHFKWTPRGKRRIHQKPSARDVATCRPFLTREQQLIAPRLVVALGLVAAHGLLGKAVRLGDVRGSRIRQSTCDNIWVTSHPSAILRMPEPAQQAAARQLMVRELREAVASLGSHA